MNLYQLRYFAELAREQHYTNAAQRLNISQPSLSHAISQLEEELGIQLFEKIGRGTRLTEYGSEFLQCVKRSLSILDNGIEEMQRHARGEGLIRLGFLNQLGVEFIPSLASRFLSRNADLKINFTFHADRTPELLEGLKQQRFDLVFCARPVESEDFSCVPIDRQELVLIVQEDHPLASKDRISLDDTLEYPYIFFDNSTGLRPVIDELFEKIGKAPKIAYETDEEQVIFGLVSHGFGIAVTPYRELLLKLNIKILSILSPTWEGNIYMVSNKQAYLTPAVKNFRDFILHHLLEQAEL
ncbi:MAG: LysR family transcriptional regulator [Ruminococcus sp.]|jgi:DNA-binding transcriptional LysR family regulator|nr:LysR family transcriptional regulator [Ruminococcus sp.]